MALFKADLHLTGRFAPPDFSGWRVPPENILWDAAFVTLAADNERDPTGAVQNPHPLVDRARERDHPIHLDQLLVGQPDRRSHVPDALSRPPCRLTSLRDGHLPIAAAQKLIERPSTASAASPSTSASVGWG